MYIIKIITHSNIKFDSICLIKSIEKETLSISRECSLIGFVLIA